jgi:hypothetical protein
VEYVELRAFLRGTGDKDIGGHEAKGKVNEGIGKRALNKQADERRLVN